MQGILNAELCVSCLTFWILFLLCETQLVGLQISFSNSLSVRECEKEGSSVGGWGRGRGSVVPGP